MNEMKANFDTLLTQYPSGMKINSLLAAKNFGVKQEHILIGNGAAELIKCLMDKIEGRVGFIRPTFEEYPNRYNKEQSVYFIPQNLDFHYTADDLMNYFEDKNIENLVLINPDNPSGNYIPKKNVLRLLKWCKERNIRLILDESFVDFAEEENSTMICEEMLALYNKFVVVKSISKSYGVPGLRLGILVSADERLIADMKKEVSIWNINSFGEFYMQIEEKYHKDYELALEKIKETRRKFAEELKRIPSLRVIPTQANYIMVEIVNGMKARELTKTLLVKYNLFIKDLTGKVNQEDRQYIRLAIRNEEDNKKMISALIEVLQSFDC